MHCRLAGSLIAILLICLAPVFPEDAARPTVYDFSLVDAEGKVVPLSTYKGKVLLIVNLASQSEYNGQIQALDELDKTYASQGLVVLGIPSPDFGGEELKDVAAMHRYYAEKLQVSFPVFAPAILHGVHTIPLYEFLCDSKKSVPGGEIHWNFTKFLIDREGKPLARYEVSEDPADVDFHVIVESALAGKLKKQTSDKKDEADTGSRDDYDQ